MTLNTPQVLNDFGCVANRALFLDIDGVLNSTDWTIVEWKKRLLSGIKKPITNECDPIAVSHLNSLIQLSRPQIVITSTWRKYYSIQQIVGYLKTLGFKHSGAVVGATPIVPGFIRGAEIDQYLQEHPEIKHYCILDDDSDMLPSQKRHFVQVLGDVGLTHKNILQCLSVFDRKIVCE
jgi:hypothetical protein